MDKDINWQERRAHPRIAWHFVVRFKSHQSSRWDFSTLKDLSLGGCYFISSKPFELGEILDLEIKIPSLNTSLGFTAEVRRCQGEKMGVNAIGVSFIQVDESQKKALQQTVDFFLKK